MQHGSPGHLTPQMTKLLADQETVFISCSGRDGACDASFQAGPPGFVRVLDDATLMYPVYDSEGLFPGGEGLGESRRVALLFVDFPSGLALRVDGRTRIIEHAAVEAFAP